MPTAQTHRPAAPRRATATDRAAATPHAATAPRSALADEARAVSWWAQVRGVAPEDLVTGRSARCVAVVGSGRLGAVTADVLASSGVGTVLLDDAREVRPGDVGTGGLREHHVGRRRDDAVAELVSGAYRETSVAGPSHDVPEVVVLVVEEGFAALRTARMVADGIPHLVVTVTGWGAVVGPFVLPGETACVRCVALHEEGSAGEAGDGRPGDVGGAGHDGGDVGVASRGAAGSLQVAAPQPSTVAAVAGALAGAEVVAYLDGRRPATAGASIEVETLDAMPRLRGWSVHPRCGCTGMGVLPPVG